MHFKGEENPLVNYGQAEVCNYYLSLNNQLFPHIDLNLLPPYTVMTLSLCQIVLAKALAPGLQVQIKIWRQHWVTDKTQFDVQPLFKQQQF